MGEAAAGVGRPPGRPREERLRRHERALDRRAPAARPGAEVRAEFVDVTEHTAGAGAGRSERRVGRRRLEPGRAAPVRRLHGGARLRQLGARAGRPARPGPARRLRERASAMSLDRVQGAMPFVVGKKAGCPDGTAVRFEVAGPGHDARAFTIAVEGRTGQAGRRRRRPTVDAVAVEPRFPASRLRTGHGGTDWPSGGEGVVMAGDAAVGRRCSAP